jgi:filamentous hemagglutinin family protein
MVLNTSLPGALAEVVLQSEINGSITVSPLGSGITQGMNASDGAIGHFSDFDIAAGHTVTCVQPSANANALFKIFSGDGTQILGDFDANGNVFLIDPAGILFGANSQVNVNRLVASTLDIDKDDFLAGKYEFFAGEGNTGTIVNNGAIGNKGLTEGVALIGRKILNTGTITTSAGGFVVMAAGDKVLLGQPGSQILTEMYSVSLPEEGDGEVINDGHISASAGTVVLAAGDVFASAVELPKASGGVGRIEQNGHIHADGTTGDGGNVSLTAADEVVLALGSQTTANAATGGDAGLVVVHSMGRTMVKEGAQIQAKGGHVPHDLLDDFDDVVETTVEVSGDYVNLAGSIDASATGSKRGKIIIDALDMTVANGSKPAAPLDNTVYEKWIENQSTVSTDVELVAHSKDAGNITVARMTDGEITGGSGDIVLRTKYDTGAITFLTQSGLKPTAIRTTKGGNIYMLAGEGGITTGDIVTNLPQSDKISEPGKIRLLTTNNGSITTGKLSVEGGSYDEISVIASGDLTIAGNVTTYAHQVDEDREVGQARTCLISEHGSVDIAGQVTVEAHGKYNTTADIHIDAGQDIKINLGGGQIRATAKTSSVGPANASVLIHAGKDTEGPGNILITDDGVNPTTRANAIYLEAKPGGGGTAYVSYGDALWDVEVGAVYDGEGNLIQGSHAKLEIDENRVGDCPECPAPPGLVPPLDPWAFRTHMNTTIWGNVLEGKTGLTIKPGSWSTETPHGTLTIEDDGSYIYTPDAGFVGQDRFTYRAITDKGVETDLVEVTITVTNNPPIQHDDTVIMDQGQSSVIIDVLANDYDPDLPEYTDVLTVIQDSITVKHGKLILNDDNTFTYIPDPGYVGQDSFTYAVKDGQSDQNIVWSTVVIWVNNAIFMPAAPIPETVVIEVSGCPALIQWVAAELGTDEKNVQIWMANSLASARDIQPCSACANLKTTATILQDVDGTHVAALTQVISQFASSTAPPTEEQMASIAGAIANNIEGNRQYAAAGEYLDALAKYVGILTSDMGFSVDESVQFATDNYVQKLAEGENLSVATYVAAKLAALGGS